MALFRKSAEGSRTDSESFERVRSLVHYPLSKRCVFYVTHRVSHALVSVYIRVLSRRQFDQAVGTDDFPFGATDAFPGSIESKNIRVNQNRFE